MTKKKEEPAPQMFENHSCKCIFTPEELAEKTDRLARKLEEKERKEEMKKETASQFKAEIEALGNEIKLLGNHLRNKYEFRSVKCEVLKDFVKGEVRTYRTDTGELIKERHMSTEERQTELAIEVR